MKLSRPIIEPIRLDTDFLKAIGQSRAKYNEEFKVALGYSEQYPQTPYYIDIKLRLIVYTDQLTNEIAGYTAESYSIILSFGTPDLDSKSVLHLLITVYDQMHQQLQLQTPYLGISHIEKPDFNYYANGIIQGAVQSGLYQS